MDFNDLARQWDDSRRIERAKIISNEIRNNLWDVKLNKGLEFGCGTGLITFNLTDLFNDVTLIDISSEMIEVVNEKIEKFNLNNCKAISCDLMKSDNLEKYDCIYTSMAMHHIIDVEEILNRFYEILNEKGKLCIVELNKDNGYFHKNEEGFNGHNGFSQKDLKNILEKYGFKNINSYTFYNSYKEVGCEKIEYSLFIIVAEK